MIRKVIALSMLLTVYQSYIQSHSCSRPKFSSASITWLSHLHFISYARALQFPCTGPFWAVNIFLNVTFLLMWPFAVQKLLCFVDGNMFGVWKMNINYCEANIADTKWVKPRYSATVFPPQFLAVELNRNMLRYGIPIHIFSWEFSKGRATRRSFIRSITSFIPTKYT